MPTLSIPISGLNVESVAQSSDFVPIVDSASLTTYRVTVQALVGDWMNLSGSASSSHVTTTASFANTASYAVTSSYSITSSFANTASYAVTSSYSNTASHACSSSYSVTSSYSITSSFANNSLTSISSSWATQSLSSSYSAFSLSSGYLNGSGSLYGTASWSKNAITASYISSSGFNFITFVIPSIPIISSSYTNAWKKFILSSAYFLPTLPQNVHGILLQGNGGTGTIGDVGVIYVSSGGVDTSSVSHDRILTNWVGSGYAAGRAGFGIFPVSSSSNNVVIYYNVTSQGSVTSTTVNVDLLGYF